MKNFSMKSSSGFVATVVAAAGTAVAIAIVVRRQAARKPNGIMKQCGRAIDQLEDMVTGKHSVPMSNGM